MGAITTAAVVAAGAAVYSADKMSSASKRAGRMQADAQMRAAALQEPFLGLSERTMPEFERLFIRDPSGATFLQENPLFDAAVANADRSLKAGAAASGKLNSGALVDQLFQNYLATGDQFVNSAFNRMRVPLALGQAAASGQAANLVGAGDAQAAGVMGAANAQANAANNIAGIASNAIFLNSLMSQSPQSNPQTTTVQTNPNVGGGQTNPLLHTPRAWGQS